MRGAAAAAAAAAAPSSLVSFLFPLAEPSPSILPPSQREPPVSPRHWRGRGRLRWPGGGQALQTTMAKREFSSTLKNLKFMQRAAKKEEKPKEEEAKLQPDDVFGSAAALSRKCIVIMEGNPHPGALKGRMSFQNFNPSVDKMNQEAANPHKWQAFNSSNENQDATTSNRDDGCPSECTDRESHQNHPEIDLKRKQPEVETDALHPHNSRRTLSGDGDGRPPPQNNRKGFYKQQKREKLDWNVLRPPNAQTRRES